MAATMALGSAGAWHWPSARLRAVLHRHRAADPHGKGADADGRRAVGLCRAADAGHRRHPDAGAAAAAGAAPRRRTWCWAGRWSGTATPRPARTAAPTRWREFHPEPARLGRDARHAGRGRAVVLTGIYLVRPMFRFIQMARLRELSTALALLIVVSIAFLMNLVGLSPALGAFTGGRGAGLQRIPPPAGKRYRALQGAAARAVLHHRGAGINFSILWGQLFTVLGLRLRSSRSRGRCSMRSGVPSACAGATCGYSRCRWRRRANSASS